MWFTHVHLENNKNELPADVLKETADDGVYFGSQDAISKKRSANHPSSLHNVQMRDTSSGCGVQMAFE